MPDVIEGEYIVSTLSIESRNRYVQWREYWRPSQHTHTHTLCPTVIENAHPFAPAKEGFLLTWNSPRSTRPERGIGRIENKIQEWRGGKAIDYDDRDMGSRLTIAIGVHIFERCGGFLGCFSKKRESIVKKKKKKNRKRNKKWQKRYWERKDEHRKKTRRRRKRMRSKREYAWEENRRNERSQDGVQKESVLTHGVSSPHWPGTNWIKSAQERHTEIVAEVKGQVFQLGGGDLLAAIPEKGATKEKPSRKNICREEIKEGQSPRAGKEEEEEQRGQGRGNFFTKTLTCYNRSRYTHGGKVCIVHPQTNRDTGNQRERTVTVYLDWPSVSVILIETGFENPLAFRIPWVHIHTATRLYNKPGKVL